MNLCAERQQYSIVLIGEFNPAMFQPEWFSRNNIIAPEEIDVIRNELSQSSLIVTPQLTIFKTSQLNIKIEQKRFEVVAEKEPLISIVDFVSKTFNDLSSFAIKAFGFNYSAHYKIIDMETYQRIADNLAPKSYWKTLLGDEITGVNRKSGLTAIQMRKAKEDQTGYYTVILQPSVFVTPGIFMSCNDHMEKKDEVNSAENVIQTINDIYESSFKFMKKIQTDALIEAMDYHE